jgi:hypothetical protein
MTGGTLQLVGGFWAFKQGPATTCPCSRARTETEPNNAPATANDLGAVSFCTVVGTLPLGDADYYRFTAPTNAQAWITVDTGGMQSTSATTRDSVVTLLASDGTTVLETDNNDGTGNGSDNTLESDLASAIAGCTLPGGQVYIRVHGTNGALAPYRLFLTITTTLAAESEPNDTAPSATPIVRPAAPTGVRSGFLGMKDMDYYAVTVSGRSLLHISADADPERDGSNPNLIVDLITRDGSTVLFSADSSLASQPDAPAEGFGFVVASNGTYYVRVWEATGQTGSYHLMVAACALPELPRLGLSTVRPSAFSVSWPASACGFRLESSADLRSWSDMPCEMTCADDLIQVSVPILGDLKRFIRMSADTRPPP